MTDMAQFMQDAEDEVWALAELVKAKRANVGERRKRKDGWWVKGPSGWEREKQPAAHPAHAEAPSGAHPSVAAWEEAAKGIEAHIASGGFEGLSQDEMRFHERTEEAASALLGSMDAATLRRASAIPNIGTMILVASSLADMKRMARQLGVPYDGGTSRSDLGARINERLGSPGGVPGRGLVSSDRARVVTALARLGPPSPGAAKALDRATAKVKSIVGGTADQPRRRSPAPTRPLLDDHADHLERMEREARAAGHHGHADRLAAVRAAMQEPKSTGNFATDFDAAFDKLRRTREFNQIELSELRKELPHLSREEFDAGLHALRRADRYELGTSDGRHRQLTPEEIAGGIEERGRQYIYVSRRMPNA